MTRIPLFIWSRTEKIFPYEHFSAFHGNALVTTQKGLQFSERGFNAVVRVRDSGPPEVLEGPKAFHVSSQTEIGAPKCLVNVVGLPIRSGRAFLDKVLPSALPLAKQPAKGRLVRLAEDVGQFEKFPRCRKLGMARKPTLDGLHLVELAMLKWVRRKTFPKAPKAVGDDSDNFKPFGFQLANALDVIVNAFFSPNEFCPHKFLRQGVPYGGNPKTPSPIRRIHHCDDFARAGRENGGGLRSQSAAIKPERCSLGNPLPGNRA